jgi:hypothetical protein
MSENYNSDNEDFFMDDDLNNTNLTIDNIPQPSSIQNLQQTQQPQLSQAQLEQLYRNYLTTHPELGTLLQQKAENRIDDNQLAAAVSTILSSTPVQPQPVMQQQVEQFKQLCQQNFARLMRLRMFHLFCLLEIRETPNPGSYCIIF